jgi:hypothetical protein
VVFGNLYLTEQGADEFSEVDEELVGAAGRRRGIGRPRLYDERQRREQLLRRSPRSTGTGRHQIETALDDIAVRALLIGAADSVAILPAEPDARGWWRLMATTQRYARPCSHCGNRRAGDAFTSGQPQRITTRRQTPGSAPLGGAACGEVVYLPLSGQDRASGCSGSAGRRGGVAFTARSR